MKQLTTILFLSLLLAQTTQSAAHTCSAHAIEQAGRLLTFHFGPDDRMIIEPQTKVLRPLKNPAGRGRYDVLEVWGNIYRGRYRMRFIYGIVSGQCVLVGQEILEYTNL